LARALVRGGKYASAIKLFKSILDVEVDAEEKKSSELGQIWTETRPFLDTKYTTIKHENVHKNETSNSALKAFDFSKRKIARVLAISRNTVSSYWNMTDEEYTAMAEQIKKQSSLVKYEPVILGWLYRYPLMTAAQVYDWLLEHYDVTISERGVRRYIRSAAS